uniref:Uncharacterized protein n=1 Tax=Chromera velia CCMP2878 TaxID=1169474 RepID=A0A0G4H409_9ALVE|eukprot:Cvel_24606.t1-p1 / transcript=Cvel_24606.t1 / gene=Cvel_24606 / organism=Chromera_velia_CCMP2878 / gene_product=hypothetical protein / transcript_product=hypothetical protein / location=Cvel_scaffold2681:16529-16942(+) / protein_length=138 / sequence_SO=supercontig / SO=protein_coding / is_pseudo=false
MAEGTWMERGQFDALANMGIITNGNSWRVLGSRCCLSVWVPSFSARTLEGFNVKTFLEAMKRLLECPVLVVVEMALGVYLLASRDGKIYAVCGRVSARIQKCSGCHYTRYCMLLSLSEEGLEAILSECLPHPPGRLAD